MRYAFQNIPSYDTNIVSAEKAAQNILKDPDTEFKAVEDEVEVSDCTVGTAAGPLPHYGRAARPGR